MITWCNMSNVVVVSLMLCLNILLCKTSELKDVNFLFSMTARLPLFNEYITWNLAFILILRWWEFTAVNISMQAIVRPPCCQYNSLKVYFSFCVKAIISHIIIQFSFSSVLFMYLQQLLGRIVLLTKHLATVGQKKSPPNRKKALAERCSERMTSGLEGGERRKQREKFKVVRNSKH